MPRPWTQTVLLALDPAQKGCLLVKTLMSADCLIACWAVATSTVGMTFVRRDLPLREVVPARFKGFARCVLKRCPRNVQLVPKGRREIHQVRATSRTMKPFCRFQGANFCIVNEATFAARHWPMIMIAKHRASLQRSMARCDCLL